MENFKKIVKQKIDKPGSMILFVLGIYLSKNACTLSQVNINMKYERDLLFIQNPRYKSWAIFLIRGIISNLVFSLTLTQS